MQRINELHAAERLVLNFSSFLSPISPLYLPCISTVSPLYLP